MGNGLYPGLFGYNEQVGKKDRRRLQKRVDLSSLLASVPNFIGAIQGVRQAGDRRADDQLLAQQLQEALNNPTGELGPGVQGPTQLPEMAAASQQANYQPESFFQRLGRTMSLGYGGDYQPQIGPQGVLAVEGVARGRRAEVELGKFHEGQLANDAAKNRNTFWENVREAGQDYAGNMQKERELNQKGREFAAEAPYRAERTRKEGAMADFYASGGSRRGVTGITPTTASQRRDAYAQKIKSAQGMISAFNEAKTPEARTMLAAQFKTTPEQLALDVADYTRLMNDYEQQFRGQPGAPAAGTAPPGAAGAATPGGIKERYASDPAIKAAIDQWAAAFQMKAADLTDQDWMAAEEALSGDE